MSICVSQKQDIDYCYEVAHCKSCKTLSVQEEQRIIMVTSHYFSSLSFGRLWYIVL